MFFTLITPSQTGDHWTERISLLKLVALHQEMTAILTQLWLPVVHNTEEWRLYILMLPPVNMLKSLDIKFFFISNETAQRCSLTHTLCINLYADTAHQSLRSYNYDPLSVCWETHHLALSHTVTVKERPTDTHTTHVIWAHGHAGISLNVTDALLQCTLLLILIPLLHPHIISYSI